MENNKLTIIIVVGIIAFFAAPIVIQKLRPVAAPAPVAPAQVGVPSPAPGGYPGAPNAPAPGQAPAPLPGGLNAQTLPGTMWEVSAKQGTIKFQFNPGGQGLGLHPLIGQIPATWSCSGNQVNVTATAMGQTMNISAMIQGNDLVGQGCTIRRLQ